ncbi:ferredoxin-type protein naph [hydrocarbon metagenome]|uniref:Ferredoxin-type protein naph n=1 Tax=hydrocarbon metagenome TaxID=938273 RepID=A0A0W8E296_9ZZZZ
MDRRLVQYISALLSNANLTGFVSGRIYQGVSKHVCVPGLNCYSCPAAIGACPLGSLQTILASSQYTISYYVTGTLLLFGVFMGRLVCGWLCPFGLIQELLNKLPSPIWTIPRWAGYIKYLILIVFVLLLPMFFVNKVGMGDPTFCKYICPAGTLEGGIPLLASHPQLRDAAGYLFLNKFLILIMVLMLSVVSFRPFCKIVCPLGAIYGLFNPISMYRFQVDADKCISCGTCARNCRMSVAIYKEPGSWECIRCGECRTGCPTGAITTTFKLGGNEYGEVKN